MTLEKFTIKAQEAIHEAVSTAQRNGQQTIEPVHLLAGIMNKAQDVMNFLLQKLGVNAQQIDMTLQSELQHLPRVTGGEPYLSGDANRVLLKAQDYAQKMGDEFVSVEPLLLALLTARSEGTVAIGRRQLPVVGQVCQEPGIAGPSRQAGPRHRT